MPKTIRLNATHYFIIETLSKRKHQQTTSNHFFDTVFKEFIKLYKEFITEPFLFLVCNKTLP